MKIDESFEHKDDIRKRHRKKMFTTIYKYIIVIKVGTKTWKIEKVPS